MARRSRILFLIIVLGAAGIVWLFQGSPSGPDEDMSASASVEQRMEGVDMVGLSDDASGHYRLEAKSAVFLNRFSSAELESPVFSYTAPDSSFSGSADRGRFDGNLIVATGVVSGQVNGIEYLTGEDGRLEFDLGTDSGVIAGGVRFIEQMRSIRADGATFDLQGNTINFTGGVHVEYVPVR